MTHDGKIAQKHPLVPSAVGILYKYSVVIRQSPVDVLVIARQETCDEELVLHRLRRHSAHMGNRHIVRHLDAQRPLHVHLFGALEISQPGITPVAIKLHQFRATVVPAQAVAQQRELGVGQVVYTISAPCLDSAGAHVPASEVAMA